VSEIDIEAEEERTEGFWWENMDSYVKQREAFYDVSGPQNNAKDVTLWGASSYFSVVTWFITLLKRLTLMLSNIRIQEAIFFRFDHQ
jgi:GH35 family endo-1,4-beta-xylanase